MSRIISRIMHSISAMHTEAQKSAYCTAFSMKKIDLSTSMKRLSDDASKTKADELSASRVDKTLLSETHHFINRNPRNLEMMGIAWKRKGWRFQYPTKEYYHRIVYERTNKHTMAYLEHSSGARVVSASTQELAISRHLYSKNDVSAAANIGRVLARRCLESGITSAIFQPLDHSEHSEKLEAFRSALKDGHMDLTEIDEVEPQYEPGIDYSDPEALSDLERRQWLILDQGKTSELKRYCYDNKKLIKGRRYRRRMPIKMESPSYNFY